ncbi:MAG: pyruvate dehydrogenase (acetyl-transferring), homodimeric type, partial [Gammaproteobacteria bacterium]
MAEIARFDDIDPTETQEWLESIDSVLRTHGPERAHFLLDRLIAHTRRSGAYLPFRPNTAYLNTIPTVQQAAYPGDRALERRIEAYIRWNAMAMVVQANRRSSELGGHISTYASSATLYEVGFNHFWRAPNGEHPGDMIFIQGHSAPGIYARAYLEGRLTEQQLNRFRQETGGGGLSSYPHPWLMPDFWQFPTVSMGLGPLMALYQARFSRYLEHRGIIPPTDQKVWCFLGDGEMDEPESMGALTMPVREGLDNLVFVVNCNLQRLDGPVRGNGKIIQELEAAFLGAGWNVIKVLWGSRWDPLLAKDEKGLLRRRMEECVDGEYQNFKAKGGGFTRDNFFGKYPELKAMVANMTDDDIWRLNRGGHDPFKVYAAYAAAAAHTGQPTVILAKTVKGFGMGASGESLNIAHQQKKLDDDALRYYRDRFRIPISDEEIAKVPFYKPPEKSEEMEYLLERRGRLGGSLPVRRHAIAPLRVPGLEAFKAQLEGSGDREISTTMALVRIITILLRDQNVSRHIVPIVPDEARTFGMEGLFRQFGIYSSVGQLYTPQDADQLMYYREDKTGQMLEEGINEAGAISSWAAAGTAYANHGAHMVPFYMFYSMFGFQRVGDFAWAAGDMQARGFLIGCTAGRTTLAGEGLQHQDGHSHVMAATIPNCVAYDPAFAYELAIIVQDGMRRMYQEMENVFYYITCMNENYRQPAMPPGVEQGVLKGMYLLQIGGKGRVRAQLLGSGTILREVIAAADMLEADFGVPADVWSVTSFSELRREGLETDRWNRLHPQEEQRMTYVAQCLGDREGPFIAASDYMKIVPDQIRGW